jgi:quercetin dioxygenase-like cupin family protein
MNSLPHGSPSSISAHRELSTTSPTTTFTPPREHTPTNGKIQMQITRSSIDTMKGPDDWFTGDVYIDVIAAGSEASRLGAANVHFTPGARTAWHTHPLGQTVYVTEGVGLCQCEGGPVEIIRPGDRVFFEPGENHWHGAAPKRFMVHTAMQESDDSGSPVSWGEQVTAEQYNAPTT